MQRFDPKSIEPKWQKIWDESNTYTTDLKSDKPKYLAMSMFNYPSGAGIHIGHAMNYTISDVKARFKRQQGYESYHPVGWDAFGLPAENYAIKTGVSPQESMANIIPMYHKQYKAMGWSNDWEKEIATHLPEYYKWTQWIFLQMHKHGLAYQDSRLQWWCTIDNTVLANEQVIDGKCWRHDGPNDPLAERREVKQWFFKITDYADELLEATESLDWTESVKLAQKNWIGRSQGAEVDFAVKTDLTGKDFVFLHGFTGTNQKDFWQWLKKEIENRGGKVFAPNLPNTTEPNVDEQARYVLDNYVFTDKTTLIGHSLGAAVAMKLLPQIKGNIDSLILVAPCLFAEYADGRKRPILDKACDWKFDYEAAIAKSRRRTVLLDKADHIIPAHSVQEASSKLEAKLIITAANKSHFNAHKEDAVLDLVSSSITVFTTAHDTIYGASFMVLAPEHELVEELTTDGQSGAVKKYVTEALKKSELQRQQEGKEKTGVFTGSYAVNPVNGREIPIWVADYVLAGYGTGAIMAVPGNDERDHEFAQKFNLPIIYTAGESFVPYADVKAAPKQFKLVNSGEFEGVDFCEGRQKILEKLTKDGVGREQINYKMRDWSVSRQRYWGAPIPMIHCAKCGAQPVPEKDLPVVLPELDDFQPAGDGRSALARATDWLKVDCPKCGGEAERETDTLDTYICSSWYMYRYMDPHNQEEIFDSNLVKKWEPIDFYNGADHATAHLLYARFIGHFFKKIGLVDEPEPFKQFLFNGKVTASDGTMFSKSKGNGVDPLEIIDQGYGADALRTYLMFAAPLEIWIRWDPQGVPGAHRFLSRVWNLVGEYNEAPEAALPEDIQRDINRSVHAMIKKMTEDIEANRYNTAIAAAMTCTNELYTLKSKQFGQSPVWHSALQNLVACIAPFAPHTAEELWHQLGHSTTVHRDTWPKFDAKYLEQDTVKIVIQVNGKLRGEIEVAKDATKEDVIAAAQASERVAPHLKDKEVRKTIVVPGKLINFVV